MVPHTKNKGTKVVHRRRVNELTIIKPQTNPKVVHQHGEEQHHCSNAPWTTKFVATKCLIFGKSWRVKACLLLMFIHELVLFFAFGRSFNNSILYQSRILRWFCTIFAIIRRHDDGGRKKRQPELKRSKDRTTLSFMLRHSARWLCHDSWILRLVRVCRVKNVIFWRTERRTETNLRSTTKGKKERCVYN